MTIYVGQNIRSLRIRRQVSQEDLAASMGVTVQAISKWETGKAFLLCPQSASAESLLHRQGAQIIDPCAGSSPSLFPLRARRPACRGNGSPASAAP